MIAVIDNYDSFVYNLVQYLGELGAKVQVLRNDAMTVPELVRLSPEAILISPGPCTPDEAGISLEVTRTFATQGVPILGVCLGHQVIGQAFGGRVVRAPEPVHGKTSLIYHWGDTLFQGLPNPFHATRYHSLVVERESLPPELAITAETDDGLIMGIRHRRYPVAGIQFHPESILTEGGKQILANFLASIPVRR
ncbi:MAG: anthranilate synthase component 2 [Bacillus thermozeamaize]|uniref:Anthranilate synthase component 2 n=1 Tax=Bacillus thermozeamaize TaxID=230954 RepID=A0A1Y3PI76_9BACI|nr:MAG: anthranilate synthase component 2 [Bacillus thermozeamaize]